MLRACVLSDGAGWEDSLPYAEFSYNNSYQRSIKKSPFEVLYGRKCRTPLNWSQTGDSKIFDPLDLMDAERQVHQVRDRLKTAQSRQKSYYDSKHRSVEFEVNDFVYLRVTPMKGMKRFQVRGKLAPRYIGPFRIVERKGKVAYQLDLPEKLSGVHDVFHVSQLRKCVSPPTKQADLADLDVGQNLTYIEHPIKILDESERRTRSSVTKFYKVQWDRHTEEEATWEREDTLLAEYPYILKTGANLGDEIQLKGGRSVASQNLAFSKF
jgi:hypothetical protein